MTQLGDSLARLVPATADLRCLKDRTPIATRMLKKSLTEVEDVNIAKAILDLQLSETPIKPRSAATAKMIQPSFVRASSVRSTKYDDQTLHAHHDQVQHGPSGFPGTGAIQLPPSGDAVPTTVSLLDSLDQEHRVHRVCTLSVYPEYDFDLDDVTAEHN